jgi:hypothetical protein
MFSSEVNVIATVLPRFSNPTRIVGKGEIFSRIFPADMEVDRLLKMEGVEAIKKIIFEVFIDNVWYLLVGI